MNTSPKITILEQISEDQILKFYLPEYNPEANINYRSPFSDKDDHPSLNIYQKNGKLFFKSHNTGHQGDIFQLVADLKGLDCKRDFQAVLAEIEKDLRLQPAKSSIDQKQNIRISYEPEPHALYAYFSVYGVSPDLLDQYQVKQVKYHEFKTKKGKLCKFDYRRLNQLAICYQIEQFIKVYFPKLEGRQEKQFGYKDQTNTDVFGWKQLGEQPVQKLFIAAGEKDCLVLNAHGFKSIAFQSENTIPSKEQIAKINQLANQVFIVYDNDKAGIQAMQKLAQLTNWKGIEFKDDCKDVADFFLKHSTSDFEQLLEHEPVTPVANNNTQELYTIFHQAEDYLIKYYDFRYNTISLDIEYSLKDKGQFKQVNENQLFVTMNKAGIRIGMDKLICILRSDFVPLFNPLSSYFENLPAWDQVDYIGQLASYLHTDAPRQLEEQFRKWLVRSVHCAIEPSYYNKQAFILVHNKQNSGKTSFCRFLCPPALSSYIAENISDDKDSRIALVKNFLINLDELSSLARHEINSLKALFSKDCINERLPYDRKNSIIPRVANFIGSTNMGEFLTDETGSVRWLCFEINGIDWNYRQDIDINKVWAQAYYLHKIGYAADMNVADIAENEQRNAKFQQRSVEAEIIPTLLQPSDSSDNFATFMTATDVLNYLTIYTTLKLNRIMIGRAMPLCGFQRIKDSQSDRYGYYCRKLKE